MTTVFGDILPAAVGIALSPFPIIAVILILGTPRAKANGLGFGLGWLIGLATVGLLVLTLASGGDSDSTTATIVDLLRIALGVGLLFLALKQWRNRPRAGEEAPTPKWMAGIDRFTPGKSLGMGAALSGINPKSLMLTTAAVTTIARAGLSQGEALSALAVFVILASVTVLGPVVYFLVAGERASGPLASMKQFMAEHNTAIMIAVLLILGVKLIGAGVGGLGD